MPTAMTPELSSNWKKLQAQLKQGSTGHESREPKYELTPRCQGSIANRRHISTPLTSGTLIKSKKLVHRKLMMGTWSSISERSKSFTPSASLAVWAEDNDISAEDVAEAYGVGMTHTSVQGHSSDTINVGLSKDVEISPEVAMDCEMVGVGGDEHRSVVARVSIVNYHCEQVYDSFVRPKEFVTDWRTHVSGVSSKNMASARTFEEVQQQIAEVLKDKILVGHSIQNDLSVMMLTHPKKDIRDTARFSEFRKYSGGKTPSLKKLAYEILGVEIHGGQHSSIEDARAAMLLFRRHRKAFDAEVHSRYAPRTVNQANGKSKSKRRRKNKR